MAPLTRSHCSSAGSNPNDVIASPEQIRGFFARIGSQDKMIHWYEKSYHLLLHDLQHEEVLRDATQWLESHLGTKNIAADGVRH